MSRSRAFNRFNRLVAKRRRMSLRAGLPSMKDGFFKESQTIDNSKGMKLEVLEKDIPIDLLELEAN